jgi:hypothetical protein
MGRDVTYFYGFQNESVTIQVDEYRSAPLNW